MQVVEFLHTHGLAALCERYAIRAKRHGVHPNLVQLKYSQLSSEMHEPIVQECRGVILDEANGWRVVARAYDKFFNLGEPNAVAIDWSTATVYDKLDGSLMTVYWYEGHWHVASSGVPDAAGLAHVSGKTFGDLFRNTWASLGYRWPDPATDSRRCFMFELMTPENRIVVNHARPRIVLHGVRDLKTMAEQAPEPVAERYGWECVRTMPLTSAADCIAAAKFLEPLAAEGFIVRDAGFRRVKVKSPKYVEFALMKGSMTGRRILEIVRRNESDEFLAYFPEFRSAYDRVRQAFEAMCQNLEADYARLKSIPEQREFAAEAMKTMNSSPLFAIRSGKCATVREFFATASMASLERTLGVDLEGLITPAGE